ncbi:MAG: efflux RND transporter periplasmic adaptor subunit [Selenomonadaceae bacterium]|nr:efflux RND transporter periplasmic adaptor subunit [Selenomonadaceae bacterium]MBR4695211.1 efflux RND transporter periplasmic adaptor subunit [Selenomonadaceae bacterium]
MKKIFGIAIVIILLMAVAIVGWGAWLNYSDEHHIADRMDSRVVELTAARAKVREFSPAATLDAIRFSSDTMADAVALTDGRILQWHVGKNTDVRKGDILVNMANENIPLKIQQAESAISKAEAALAQAYNAYQRQERLLQRRATSQEKYEAAEAQCMAAQGALREAQAQRDQCLVQQGWLSVESPVDGEVLIIYQREGSYVQAGTPIALVGDFQWLHFSLNISDNYARNLKIGEESFLTFPNTKILGKAYDTDYGAGNKGPGMELKASLREIVPPLSEPADIRRTVWEVDNRTHILEPMIYTGVTMRAGIRYQVLTVPLSAMADQSHDKVFVVDGEGIIHSRSVVAGADDDKYIEIYEGLDEGEIVVVGSFEGLEDGMKVEAELEGEDA